MKKHNSNKASEMGICFMSVPLPNVAGGDIFLKQFIGILQPLCQKLYVIAGNFPETSTDKIRIITNPKAWEPSLSISARSRRYILSQLQNSIDLIRIVRNCDLIVLYSGTQIYLIPTLIAKLFRKKVLLVHQGSLSKPLRLTHGKKWFVLGAFFCWFISLLEQLMFYLSDRLVMESESVVEFLGLGKFRRKISIGDYRYIDIGLYKIKKGLKQRRKLIGYIGHFTEEKGAVNFAKATPLIIGLDGEAEFLMIGTAPLTNRVQILLTRKITEVLQQANTFDTVSIMGRVHPEKIPDFLNELKLLVLPSSSEGLPGILREAMACGTSVVAMSVGGVPDLIRDNETGFIMEDNSTECIARNVIRALNHPNLEEITRNARALIEKEYSPEAAAKKWGHILMSLR